MKVRWFEMDETELICNGQIPEFYPLTNQSLPFMMSFLVMIDFLFTPVTKGTEKSSGPCSNDDASAWRFAVAKEIVETLS